MESLWQLFGILIFVGFGLLDISYAHPIGEIRGPFSAGDGNPGGGHEGGGDGGAGAWLTGILGPSLMAAAVLFAAGGAALVGCCACCRKSPKGFQPNERKIIKEFTDSGSSHSLSTGGYVNPAASGSSPANEFTIFPPAVPASGGGGPVSFEPLPDIRPRQTHGSPTSSAPSSTSPATSAPATAAASRRRSSQKKPAAFNNAVSHGLSAQDWFDDPHENFPRSQLKYLCEFGKGWFGRVVEGEALGLVGASNGISLPTTPTRVVVKILHGDATPTDQMYFLHEVRYLRDLTPHPNILQLLGRCLETDPFLIILEACPNGDLKTFLLQNLATAEALSMQGVILRMACNVAAGLQHMHERGFVHTDLAARNCLVAPDLTVKIGDYGTSIENFKDDYYCAGDVALPIRWCAPETLHCTDTTIETKEVTAAANIWSLGVLLWEVCEFGRLPYSELNDEEVIVKVLGEKSLHLGPPTRSCLHASNLYHLMRLCWNPDNKRPGITQVAAMLDNLYLHPEELPSSSVEDFERRWAITKPNGMTAMVETIVHEPPMEMQRVDEEEEGKRGDLEPIQRNLSPSPHPSLHGEPLSPSIKHKSPSLQNLRGSLEDLVGCSSPVEDDVNKEVCSSVCELDVSSCDITHEVKSEASWLHDGESQGVTEDDEDAQFVRKISEAIRDLDDVLALEKTSSSSGSGTSPEEHSPTKKRFAQQTHDKVDENGVLDFRLGQKNDDAVTTSESVHGTAIVIKENTKGLPFNTMQMDSLQWDAESVQEEQEKTSAVVGEDGVRKNKENNGQNTTRHELNQDLDGIEWKVELDSTREELDSRIEKPKTAMEVAQEEEEEVWRQRVERGEFSAKVREKSRSVQDLMVLTHIEDSSEGSDSEGGVVVHGKCTGSPPPGPLLPSTAPSFGSVGDLRTAVLGEEFRHTLERLCAANKRGPLDQSGSPLTTLHSNLSEEPEDKRDNIEVSREFDEQLESSISSQNDENGDHSKGSHETEQATWIHQLQLVDSTVNSLPTPLMKDNRNIVTTENCIEVTSKDLDGKGDICTDNTIPEVQSPLKVQFNQLQIESSKTLCGIMTSTPLVGAYKRPEILNEDSFLFDLTPLDSTFPAECTLEEKHSSDCSVSTVDPTFPEYDQTVNKIVNTEIQSFTRAEVGTIEKLYSGDSEATINPEEFCNEACNINVSQKTPSVQHSNAIVVYAPLENMEIKGVSKNDKLTFQSKVNRDKESSADLPLPVHNSIVSRLSVLAEQSLSTLHIQSRLNDNLKNPVEEGNRLTNFLVNPSIGEKMESLGLVAIQEKDDKNIDQITVEKYHQDSPMNEFPGEVEEQSPLHALTCGISGSQSTVECRSPLALSPVTVGVEDFLMPTSTVMSYSCKDVNSMIQSSNDTSPCDEKFKSDGVTKEINSDFIFTVDATVENMDAVVKPDLLLDSEIVQKEISGSKGPSSLIDPSNIGNQENVVETLISNIEVDRNCDKSWIKPHTIDKDIESSHILLDLVQINSNGLQNLSNNANILSSIIHPKEVISSVEKGHSFPTVPEFTANVKDFNCVRKSHVIEKEIMALEKDSILSDAANSEECDSAGTEDSVFDFSPPVPGDGNAPIEVESGSHPPPRVKQIRFLSEGEEVIGRFGGEKNDFDSVELKECIGEEEDAESQGAEGGREDDEDEELGLLGTKQWTPDDERSSDSGFRDKGSLSESVEDACERCDLADVETGAEEEELGIGGGEATADGDEEQAGFMSCNYPGELDGECCVDENVDHEHKNSQLHYPGTSSEENSFSSSTRGEGANQEDFWRQQIASLRQAAGDTATLLREASAPTEHSSWIEGEAWDDDVMGNTGEMKMLTEGDDGDRGLDEASLAALRSELQEKLGGSNSRSGIGIEMKREDGSFERANSEEHLSDEDEEDGEEMNEERTDITIHYDAYLAQLSPILEERESVGSSEMYSPATKEPPRDSVSDDSATTASVNDIGDNHVFSSDSNIKDPALTIEDVLIVDTSTNKASLMVSSPIDFRENDATSPEFSDSLEDDDDEDNNTQGKSEQNSPKWHSELQKEEASQKHGSSAVRYAIPPSDFWSGMPNLTGGQVRPSIGSPLLLPPPPSSAPMPSPEEERAGCVERAGSNKIPIFRDFEDIVALCQSQGDDFGGCDEAALEGLRGDSQRSSEEMDIANIGTTANLPFWESESSDGNDSSSSGEFVWKEGERDVPPARTVDASISEPVSRVYESISEFPMAVIEEEDEDEAGDGEDGKDDGASDSSGSVMEFIPSAWNSAAEPSRSSLRSPDRKSDQKKNVSFKRQKYHCVYEYPKEEASDSEGEGQDSPTRRRWDIQQQAPPFDYSSYADWELMEGDIPEGIIPGDVEVEPEVPNAAANHRQFDFYKLSSEDYDFGFAAVTPEVSEGEFMVSSSSRPFQYCTQDSPFSVGSQFFPGLSLAASSVPGWVAGRRSPWSKNGEENTDMNENIREEVKVGDNVPDLLADTVAQDTSQRDGGCIEKMQKSADGGTLEWSSQQPLPSPVHSSSSSGSLSSCSPPASPLSPTGLGELRHTRDRLKLDLPHKFSLSEVVRGRGARKERTGEIVGNCKAEKEGSVLASVEVKEMKVRRRAAEEQKGEASLLDAEKEREGVTKTAL